MTKPDFNHIITQIERPQEAQHLALILAHYWPVIKEALLVAAEIAREERFDEILNKIAAREDMHDG